MSKLATWLFYHFSILLWVHFTKSWLLTQVFIGSLTWCLSLWSRWEHNWQRPHSQYSGTACYPGTNQNQTDLAHVSQCTQVPPVAQPHGQYSTGRQYHQHCKQKHDIFILILYTKTWSKCTFTIYKQKAFFFFTYLLPANRRTFALSRPLFSRSFTTSWIISEPMKA